MISIGIMLACVSLACTMEQCPQSACSSPNSCRNRDKLICALNEGLRVGWINTWGIIIDPRFGDAFGSLPNDVRDLHAELENGGITTLEGLEELIVQFSAMFMSALRETCRIPVRDYLQQLIYGSVDAHINQMYWMLYRLRGPVPECPNRHVILRQLRHSLERGYLNVRYLILNPHNSVAFNVVQKSLVWLENAIESGEIPDLPTLQSYLDELMGSLIDHLEETCYILVRDDMRLLIEKGFDALREGYLPHFHYFYADDDACPNREALKDALLSVDPWDMVSQGPFAYQFGQITYDINQLTRGVWRRNVQNVLEINGQVQAAINSLCDAIQNDCHINVRRDVRERIERRFDIIIHALEQIYTRRGGSHLPECFGRMVISDAFYAADYNNA